MRFRIRVNLADSMAAAMLAASVVTVVALVLSLHA